MSGSEHRPVAGARVSYIGRDFTQVAEVYAGSGYLSQSSPTVFFGADAAAGGRSSFVGTTGRKDNDRISRSTVM